MAPFLTIVTRTCRRPVMLSACIESVLAQTCHDWEHVFIVDNSGHHPEGNILWANRQFALNRHRIDGQYVFILDDDGILVRPGFIQAICDFVAGEGYPDVVVVKSLSPNYRGRDTQLPPPDAWNVQWELGERPVRWSGHVYNEVVKADLWKARIGAFAADHGGDWYFMDALIASGATFARCDMLSARSTQRGKGQVFEACGPDWWEAVAARYGVADLGGGDWRLRPCAERRGRRGKRG